MKQAEMFPDGADLPLFSGTAQHAQVEVFQPDEEPQQTTFATCRVCMDTGEVDGRFCWCEAGQRLQEERAHCPVSGPVLSTDT